MGLRLGLINLIVHPIGDILISLNCCKLSIENTYKALQGKYKMTPNVLLTDKHLLESFLWACLYMLLEDQNCNNKPQSNHG
jgi:hypothetical protein